jgi:DNA-directed RNA polymerase specialized sigma24 family protein
VPGSCEEQLKAMVRRIKRARRFFSRSHATTWDEVRKFGLHAQRFLERFGNERDLAEFDKDWVDAFFTVPLEGRVWKSHAEDGELSDELVSFFHPGLARQALRRIGTVMLRAVSAHPQREKRIDSSSVSMKGLPKLKREEVFRQRMKGKGFTNYEDVANKAGVSVSTVSRLARRAPTRKLSDPSNRVYRVLNLTEDDFPRA